MQVRLFGWYDDGEYTDREVCEAKINEFLATGIRVVSIHQASSDNAQTILIFYETEGGYRDPSTG